MVFIRPNNGTNALLVANDFKLSIAMEPIDPEQICASKLCSKKGVGYEVFPELSVFLVKPFYRECSK